MSFSLTLTVSNCRRGWWTWGGFLLAVWGFSVSWYQQTKWVFFAAPHRLNIWQVGRMCCDTSHLRHFCLSCPSYLGKPGSYSCSVTRLICGLSTPSVPIILPPFAPTQPHFPLQMASLSHRCRASCHLAWWLACRGDDWWWLHSWTCVMLTVGVEAYVDKQQGGALAQGRAADDSHLSDWLWEQLLVVFYTGPLSFSLDLEYCKTSRIYECSIESSCCWVLLLYYNWYYENLTSFFRKFYISQIWLKYEFIKLRNLNATAGGCREAISFLQLPRNHCSEFVVTITKYIPNPNKLWGLSRLTITWWQLSLVVAAAFYLWRCFQSPAELRLCTDTHVSSASKLWCLTGVSMFGRGVLLARSQIVLFPRGDLSWSVLQYRLVLDILGDCC